MDATKKIFVGIDQTGAITPGKPHLPRPLPFAWFNPSSMRLTLLRSGLARFDPTLIAATTGHEGQLAVLIDCVLGLPSELGRTFAQVLSLLESNQGSHSPLHFGRKPAEDFFGKVLAGSIIPPSDRLPTRRCEVLAKANSVFRTRPFQKNIQTGTYRLWREITQCRSQLSLWPFDQEKQGTLVFEGYPSLLWRELFGLHSRSPIQLAPAIRKLGIFISADDTSVLSKKPDLADAAVLAVGGWLLEQRGLLGDPLLARLSTHDRHLALQEGWIAGLSPTYPSKLLQSR